MNPSSSAQPSADQSSPSLLRILDWPDATAVVVGIVIGTGIFIVPADITREMGSKDAVLAVWAVTGILSLLGALCFAELAAMMPQAGGQYVFLREAYGPLAGFLCGWSFFVAAQTAGISVLAVGFAEYANEFLPLSNWQQKTAAAIAIVVFTAINYRGVREGGKLQTLLTGAKVGAIAVFILLGFSLVKGAPPASGTLAGPTGYGFLKSFGMAMVGAFWAFEGWNACTFAAGEVKRPERNIPIALIFGTIAVIAIYVALNSVYFRVLPLDRVAHSSRVGADAAAVIFGRRAGQLVSALIIISTLGSLNGSILAAPRVYYAMAKDGLFFRWCARVHPKFRTPHLALVVQCVWAIILVAAGTYEQLFTYVIFAAFIFYALTAYAVVVLRRKNPELPRPYRVIAYPYVPLVFVIGSGCFLLNALVQAPVEAGFGTMMLAVGLPMYWVWRRRTNRPQQT